VLLSLRSPSALAVLDPRTHAVVWAARGVWRHQHDAQFLDNGRLLLLDNLGSPKGSRVLEYDPLTQATPWWWGGERASAFTTTFRGTTQRLGNGNTLVVDSDERRIMEVTAGKELVWEWFCPVGPVGTGQKAPEMLHLTGARRYRPAELTFLGGDARARPH
jgi:hypothetical protein